jgi:hypothetical protein
MYRAWEENLRRRCFVALWKPAVGFGGSYSWEVALAPVRGVLSVTAFCKILIDVSGWGGGLEVSVFMVSRKPALAFAGLYSCEAACSSSSLSSSDSTRMPDESCSGIGVGGGEGG